GNGTVTASQLFDWSVGPVVSLTTPADQENGAGDTVSVSLVASDVFGNALTYTASGLPAGLSVNASTGLISGTIAATAANVTPYPVSVTASDGTYSGTAFLYWNVSDILLGAITDQDNSDGATVSLPATASYHGAGSLTYSATGLPVGLSINASTGLIAGAVAA